MGPQLALIGNPGTWLFSYGSNDPSQLSRRIGRDVRDGQAAFVDGYERVFRGWSSTRQCGVASLKKKHGARTFGWAARVSADELRELDRYEGVGSGCYRRMKLKIQLPGGAVSGMAYVSTSDEHNAPSRAYLESCARCVGSFWSSEGGRAVRPEDFPVRNPISFTGPAITFMPFNPFQKFSVDLLGVGFQANGNGNGQKNPPRPQKLKAFHVYDKRTGRLLGTEVGPNDEVARLNASRRYGVWYPDLSAKPVVVSDVDRSQGTLFGFDPEKEIEKERREEHGGQLEMFNPSFLRGGRLAGDSGGRARAARSYQSYMRELSEADPALRGLDFEQRVQLYAERVKQGLDPFTGEPPRPSAPVSSLQAAREAEIDRRPLRAKLPPLPVEPAAPRDYMEDAHVMQSLPPIAYGRPPIRGESELLEASRIHEPAPAPASAAPPRRPRIGVGRPRKDEPRGAVGWPRKLRALVKHFRSPERLGPELGYGGRVIRYWLSGHTKPPLQARLAINELWEVMQSGMINPPPEWQREAALEKANKILDQGLVGVTPSLIKAMKFLSERRRSHAQLAKELGISKQHFSQILNGKRRRISLDIVRRVYMLLNPAAGRWDWSAANPGGHEVDPRAFDMRDRYKDDMEAGHLDAAEYWRGQAAAYFTANPCGGAPPPGMREIPELARLMNPKRKRRRNRDSKWKKEPEELEIDVEEIESMPYFKEALKKFKRFHESTPALAKVIRIPDGKKGTRRLNKVYVALGRRKQTPYTVDEWDSSKKDVYWYHDHPEGMEPLMILDPETGVVSDVGGSYVVDEWFYS